MVRTTLPRKHYFYKSEWRFNPVTNISTFIAFVPPDMTTAQWTNTYTEVIFERHVPGGQVVHNSQIDLDIQIDLYALLDTTPYCIVEA
jgi:hypothetical protein